jgi:SAM-dependent methyltransferase
MEMLEELYKHTVAQKILNLRALRGLAETLPIRDATFDLVVSRFAFHHFERPAPVVREMVRTCKLGGTVGIIDLVAPDEPQLAHLYNAYELKRDVSHSRALSEAELVGLLRSAGLVDVSSVGRDVEVDLEAWLDLAKTPATATQQIRSDLQAELQGGARTGMRPFLRDKNLMFLQRWVITVARRCNREHR